MIVHGPQMARKISLWISTLFTPITKSPLLSQGVSERSDGASTNVSIPWSTLDQNADTLVTTSPQQEHTTERKKSLGSGAVVRELLIKDLE